MTMTDTHADHGSDCQDCEDRSGVSRRGFLGVVGAGAATLGVSSLGARMAFATPEAPSTGDVLVVVFMRGGMDGLNVVAPYMMPTYRTLRPTIRVKDPTEFADPTGVAGLPLEPGRQRGAVRAVRHLRPAPRAWSRCTRAPGPTATWRSCTPPACPTRSRPHEATSTPRGTGSAARPRSV